MLSLTYITHKLVISLEKVPGEWNLVSNFRMIEVLGEIARAAIRRTRPTIAIAHFSATVDITAGGGQWCFCHIL